MRLTCLRAPFVVFVPAILLAALLPVLAGASLLVATPAHAQQADPAAVETAGSDRVQAATWEPPPARSRPFDLTIRSVMRGPELVGKSPQRVRWTDDGSSVYFRWLPGGLPWHEDRDLWRVGREGGEPERVAEDADAPPEVEVLFSGGDVSPDGRWRVSEVEGDLWLVDRRSLTTRRLTETRDRESSPSFDRDGGRIFFRSGSNLFSVDLDGTSLRQWTDIRTGGDGEGGAPRAGREIEEDEGEDEREIEEEGVEEEGVEDGGEDEDGQDARDEEERGFLEAQQEELFEWVRTRRMQREEREERARERAEERPDSVMLGRGWRVSELVASPTGAHAVLGTFRPAAEAEDVIVPQWVTESGYTASEETRTKVGDDQGSARMAILEIGTGEVTRLDFPVPDDDPDEARGAAGGVAGDPAPPEEREPIRASLVEWSEDGTTALVTAWSDDNEHTWLCAVDAATGASTELAHLEDDAWHAWRGGPCGGCVGWIPGSERAYYVDEADGWSHLYSIRADGSARRRLTSGAWELRGVEVLPDDSGFLLHSSEESPFETHAYTMGFEGGERVRLTRGEGLFEVTPSPDGASLAVVRSEANRPPELYLMAAEPGAEMRRVTRSPTEEWLSFDWIRPEIVRFTARDGARVPARIYRPADLGAEATGAAVVFVHGAGYLHNVHRGWSSYEREYMFHHLLAAAGYTVLDIDYRGSAGYGRDWRTGIYRWMGGRDLSDQVDGVRWLVESVGIDPGRVGIYGGSYGGFITLMALFTEPDVFAAGAALRSVTDWAHYNHWYTSRILNLPENDPEAYRRSSPIYFAEGLEGHLLIAHGMVDANVHFSDVVRLAQRLIELGKEDWEMAVYPVEGHGFVDPASWTDEYRRIFELFERVIGAGVGSAVVDVRGAR